jgi:pilus assembly protein Flp/PilA
MRIVRGTKKLAVALLKDESGASLLEYTVLIGIITVGALTAIGNVGTWISGQWSSLHTTLTTK